MNIRKVAIWGRYSLLLFLAVVFLLPFAWLIASSLQSDTEIFKNVSPVTWNAFFPRKPSLNAYSTLFTDRRVPFTRALMNTMLISFVTALLGVIVNGMAGFAFARYRFPGKQVLFSILLFSFLVPTELIVIPLYLVCRDLKLTNTYLGLILPMVGNGMVILMFKQFFSELPETMLEAARLDGAAWWQLLLHVVFPVARPAIIAGFLILLTFQWDTLFWPLVVAPSDKLMTVQVALSKFIGEYRTSWNVMFAGSVVSALLPVSIFLSMQKHYFTSFEGYGK